MVPRNPVIDKGEGLNFTRGNWNFDLSLYCFFHSKRSLLPQLPTGISSLAWFAHEMDFFCFLIYVVFFSSFLKSMCDCGLPTDADSLLTLTPRLPGVQRPRESKTNSGPQPDFFNRSFSVNVAVNVMLSSWHYH